MKRLITLIVGVLCTAPWSVRAQFDDAAAAQLQKLVQAYRYVDAAYVDSLDTAPLVEEAIRGMLTRLDPHSAYLSEEEMKGVDESFDGSFGGIGIEFNVLNDTVVIVNTIAGGPSAQVGLLPGDRIVGIDGQRAVGLSRAEVPKRLRGPSGTQVRLEVSRHAVKEPLAFTVTRGDIPLHTVDAAYKVDAETGYIKVNRFGRTTMQEFVEAFKGMKGVRSLILDLRGNGGGLLDQAVAMANFFLPRGSRIVSTEGRAVPPRAYTAPVDGAFLRGPVVVLIDENSASASEIVAGALQDLDRAVLIGQRSFGKGLVQSPRPLGYNAMLKLTTAKYYIPSGRCIQAIDYSHSQEGSVRAVPDSLISEFTTRAGRKVYDGGGVMPDIATDPEYISRFALTLYALGFIEDFGDEYTRRNPGRQIDIRTFSITDKDYADFAEFMQDKKVPYESDTRRALKALKKAAEDDRFADLKNKFEQVEAELKDDTQTNLETYRTQVVETINNDIVMRHGYQAGVIEHSLSGDKEVKKAVEVLGDPAEYARITREQDTKRK